MSVFASNSTTARTASGGELGRVIVAARQLCHYFGTGDLRKQILFDIEVDLHAGEIVIMTGPSGSGKTTLLTLIGGLRSPQIGSLRVFDRELVGAPKRESIRVRRHTGYIFQGNNLLEYLTAKQNVQMSLKLHDYHARESEERAIAMLEAVGLSDRIDYFPDKLSGGQKQRVAIARALVSHPKLVLADEPTAALDGVTGRSVMEIVQKLAREQGCTSLIVTHDSRILDIADRIIHLEDGRLAENRRLSAAAVT
ncbi:ABC exporter ATP-binding subunit, devA family [Rubidibacter lacunae KORDI 51-2]|uniref:ABC exporter ATP-binding subunit, devA family n=1 Tax=Rubidibacter lacunae KORDI 51-2 TaxID=582515 RepID=U5D5T4_9CHRO|nr:DevA family ABC transporter ATP-binding protein [Rubidibacter lacunae]ERN40023.1 ABC exporter ATP-binding subunit, devA family [Rubidibacter lacunae KORDI 51-2]